jgi:cephalosporin-C deacetylase
LRDPSASNVVVERPADFDAFWAGSLRELADVPLEPSLTYCALRSTSRVAVYDVRYRSLGGIRAAGWYTVPRQNVTAGPYPGLLLIPGYISEPTLPRSWSERGYAVLSVAPRGKLRANGVFNPGYPGLLTDNIVDARTYGYRGFYLDVVRGLDFLLHRPEVDTDRIGVHGSSQGGGLGIIAAALRPDVVRCVAAGAPYLCGIMAATGLTHSYPYQEIAEYLRRHPDHEPLVRETVSYYDGLNFAPRVVAPTMVYLGLEDDVCPPETGFAVYRALGGPKKLHTAPRCGHNAGLPTVMTRVEEFLDRHLTPVPPDGSAGPRVAAVAARSRVEPGDFAAYWRAVDEELAALPARAVLEPDAGRSTDRFQFFTVRLTGIGPYRIFGYLSVPTGPGPFPALLETPRYGSVNHSPHYNERLRYVVFTVMHRGQRLADSGFRAEYPGLLTQDIEDPAAYIYRGIVADCLRGAEFLFGRHEVDTSRVGVVGDDLALLTAARRPGFAAVRLAHLMFHRPDESRTRTDSYPLEELNDHLRAHPDRLDAVENTLSYFDPARHAPVVRARTLLAAGDDDGVEGLPWLAPFVEALGPAAETYRLTHEDAADDNWLDAWLANQLGARPMVRFLPEST